METGTATEQMVLRYETQCKLCLIAKTYQSYAPKTKNQGVYHNKVWSCTEFARLLQKNRLFFLGQMIVLLWTLSEPSYVCICFSYTTFPIWPSYFVFLLVGIASGKTNKFNSKRIWSAYIGQAAATYALTGAIPLLLAASTLSCWMSPLARIALPQTTWPPRVPPECPCRRRA